MTNFARIAAVLLPLTLVGGNALAAQQGNNDEIDMQAMQSAKISIAEAIKAAESATGGKVIGASFQSADGQAGYEVDVMKGSDLVTVIVDAQTGKVLNQAADAEQGETENQAGDID